MMQSRLSDRTRLVLIALVGAVTFFFAGVGVSAVVVAHRVSSTFDSLRALSITAGAGGGPAGTSVPAAPDPDDEDPRTWAREQGLPDSVPDQYLPMLKQRFPDGVPQRVKDRISQLGGDDAG